MATNTFQSLDETIDRFPTFLKNIEETDNDDDDHDLALKILQLEQEKTQVTNEIDGQESSLKSLDHDQLTVDLQINEFDVQAESTRKIILELREKTAKVDSVSETMKTLSRQTKRLLEQKQLEVEAYHGVIQRTCEKIMKPELDLMTSLQSKFEVLTKHKSEVASEISILEEKLKSLVNGTLEGAAQELAELRLNIESLVVEIRKQNELCDRLRSACILLRYQNSAQLLRLEEKVQAARRSNSA